PRRCCSCARGTTASATRRTRRPPPRTSPSRSTCSRTRSSGSPRRRSRVVSPARRQPLGSGLAEDDLLRALPEELAAERAQVLVALDDRGEVVAGELARLGGEVDVAVGEQDLGLADAARVEHDLARARVRGRVLGT